MKQATPAMRQYFEIKMRYEDALLFYRMGDFYELFFKDAEDASAILDIALTKRGKHAGEEIPMCGVPVHSHEVYLEKLIASGRKVAICEQLETPEEAKKRGGHKAVVHRDVVRLVTPGTITEETLLSPNEAHYLAALVIDKERASLAWLDISTGDFRVSESDAAGILAELARISPRELLVSDRLDLARIKPCQAVCTMQPHSQFDVKKAERSLKQHYAMTTLEPFGSLSRQDIAACGALLEYVKLTQLEQMPRLDPPQKQQAADAMMIDAATRRNLELTATLSGSRKGSLLSVIDRTVTGSGGRLLASWLTSPLTDTGAIARRQAMIAWMLEREDSAARIRSQLKETPDLERAISRLCMGRGGPRDMQSVKQALQAAQAIKEQFALMNNAGQEQPLPEALSGLIEQLGEHHCLITELNAALEGDLPLLARDGGFIRRGYQADLDHFRELRDDSKRVIAAMQRRYAEETGITSLKIKFNNVLGYFIEVTSAQESKVPDHFIHRQSLANCLRYTTTELSDTASAIHEASFKALQIELECFEKLQTECTNQAETIICAARALARLDVITALARLAQEQGYCRPDVDDSTRFEIREGRHPVVEASLQRAGESFISNGADLSASQQLWLLTGPNMAGKSTFLRQNALIAILAQMGSYVPAQSAHIGVVDRLFSRVGAADDLARGQSTFMVEMVETAMILNHATPRSLVILDEIGRGTATYDGLSIAWAVVEHLHNRSQCRALFATHYHELTQLADSLDRLACFTMQVKEWRERIVFLHQVKAGTADRSYGIHVAGLAGLPATVISRAKQVLVELEQRGKDALAADLPLFSQPSLASEPTQPAHPPHQHPLIEEMAALDPDQLSPREALDVLYKLKTLMEA